MAGSRFLIDRADGSEPIPWHPPEPRPDLAKDTVYFGRVLAEADRRAGVDGLTWVLTWSSARLPRTGDDVVAVVLSDEASRRPAYTDEVRAVFKTYGGRPRFTRTPLRDRSRLGVLVALQDLRRVAEAVPEQAGVVARRALAAVGRGPWPKPVHPIPLGYWNQLDLEPPPITERDIDVSFAGSVEEPQHGASWTGAWLESPKVLSRRAMLAALERYDAEHPERTVAVRTLPSFGAVGEDDAEIYSRSLAATKVCIVPRGGSIETYRWFEAMRYGCVVVGEPMPPHWFYRGSPAIELRSWDDLPATLERLLGDEAELRRRSAASLDWWRRRCSEEAVGAYMAERVA